MDFPRDYGFKGQWVSVTPVKPNPRIRSQSSDSNWVQSVDVNGGLVGNGDGLTQMPYRRLLGGPDPVGMGQMSLPNLLSHQISGRNGLEMMNSSHSSSNRNRFLLNEMMFSKPQYNLPVVHSFLTNLNSYPGNNQTFTAVGSEEMPAPATPVMMEKNWMERGNDLLLPAEIIDLVDDVESFGEVVQKQNETIRSYEDFRKQNEANTLQQSIVDGCFSSQYSQKQSEPATLQQSVVDGFFASQYHQKQNESTTLQQWIADEYFCSQYPQRQNKPSTLQRSIADGCFSSQYPQKQNEPDTLQQSIEDGCFNEPNRLQQSIEDGRVSSQQQEGEEMNNVVIKSCEENQGIDLNKTPQQKPKRKKFTPKVLKERKPKRTPKPVATPKTAGTTTPNPTGKRKYVRKKKDLNPEETPLSTSTPVEQTVDADGRSRSKAVRRSLNFDLEDTQERDRSLFGQNGSQIHTQAREEVHAAVDIGGKMFGQNGLEIHTEAREEAHAAVETSESSSQREGLVDLENSLRCGVGFDLNSSKNQFANETTGRIPQTPNRPSQPCRQEETARARAMFQFEFRRMVSKLSPSQVYERGNGKMLQDARRISCEEGIEDTHENGNLVDGLYQVDSPEAADVQLNGAKRAHNLVNSAQVSSHTSIMRGFNITDRVNDNNINASSSTNPCLSVINKKRRTETGQKECTSKSSTLMTYDPCRWKSNDSTGNVSLVSTIADAPRLLSNEKGRALERMLTCNQAEKDKNKRVQNQNLTFLGDLSNSHNKVSTPTATSDHHKLDFNQPKTPEKVPILSSSNQESEVHGPQARVDVLVANQKKPKPRGRKKKEQIPVVNAKSCQIEQVSEGFVTEPQVVSKKKTQILKNHQNNSSWKVPASPRAFPSYSDLVDEIVRRLMHLNINDDFPQSALVPYAGAGGLMVSYQGPFNIIKKKKPRPRVDLDPESNRVWNLLMGKESVEAEQGTEVDKEKWWEEERRVFRGRVDSFIARMHLIQGDRRFSKWKGSVVDSVIGVFLTQNVSDHLSSSAFMCLAARFPPQSNGQDSNANNVETISSRSIVINDTWQEKVSDREFCEGTNKTEKMNNKETANSNESLESNDSLGVNSEARNVGFSKENNLDYFYGREVGGIVGNESPDSASGTAVTVTSCTSAIEGEDRRSTEDVVSSQNSVASSHNSSEWAGLTIYPQLNSEAPNQSKYRQSNSEAPALIARGMGNGNNSFMELLHMAGTGRIATAEYGGGGGRGIDWPVPNRNGLPDYVNGSGSSIHASPNSHLNQNQNNFLGLSCAPSPSYYYNTCSNSRFMGMSDAAEVVNNKGYESHLPYTSIGMNNTNINERMGRSDSFFSGSSASMLHNTLVAPIRADASSPISKNSDQLVMSSGRVISVEKHHSCCQSEASSNKIPTNTSLIHQQDGNAAMFAQRKKEAVKAQAQIVNHVTQTCSNVHDDNQRKNADAVDVAESNVRTDASTPQKVSTVENLNDASEKAKKVKPGKEKKSFDWDSLRRNTCQTGVPKRERGMETMDSLDYEALRNADVNEISNTIRERGMNNLLAERIKAFLNRLVEDHGSIDLEWLRDVPPDKAKDYLLSIRGLGLKSVECIRLLTLHNLAFPVDTNVGRICVRLGWVPLQPLPESLQLHLLEMYPIQETIQKYLWPRLCKLDQPTLYELHYQLITFGKVFCTKSKPNCNSCPMRGECKHFASAYASARLALPGPEEKSIVTSEFPISSESGPNNMACNRLPLPPQLEGPTRREHEQSPPRNCEPIIEEPASPDPEPECFETSEIDIEDAFYNDPDEIPTIKLNIKEFTQNLQNYFQENNLGLQDGDDMSKALVAISPEAASIPMPKLKNVNRLRTEHLVYELPDSHPLLKGMDEREAGDPSPYLLAIWTPGETAQSIEPTKAGCNAEGTGQLCDKSTCFSCNSIREAQSQTVRGTLLIPCRTANKGSFPLNGTYFQVNEVFADHFSSCNPIDVPRDWIWNLPRRTVYFGTSIPSIFKGLTTEGIQHCFWRGFVCVRGFDRVSRAPKPLFARLHFPASKTTRNKRAEAARRNEE